MLASRSKATRARSNRKAVCWLSRLESMILRLSGPQLHLHLQRGEHEVHARAHDLEGRGVDALEVIAQVHIGEDDGSAAGVWMEYAAQLMTSFQSASAATGAGLKVTFL